VTNDLPEDLTGTVIDGRYTLERPVGQGGFGTVYAALDLYGTPCAVKLVPFSHWTERVHAREEAGRLEELACPGLVGFRGAGRFGPTAQGHVYIAMELGEGSLHDRIAVGGPLPLAETRAIVIDLLDTLDYLHARDVVHGDVKPGNLVRFGQRWKLCDLGSATRLGSAPSARNPRWSGTPEFMAPEAFDGDVRPATDLWSVGLLIHECATGTSPFRGTGLGHDAVARLVRETEPRLDPALPAPLASLIRGCLERDPARRLTSADVRRAIAGDLGEVPRPPPHRPRHGWLGPALLWGAAAAVLIWEVTRI
jgi:serine/threonine protein kinase